MNISRLGTRHAYLRGFEYVKNNPYDYRAEGLLNKLAPTLWRKIENKTVKGFLLRVDFVLVQLFDYISELKYAKDWNHHSNM